jgi:SSS family solute:Na+ symporter
MYIAAATPLVVMLIERLALGRARPQASQPNAFVERTST